MGFPPSSYSATFYHHIPDQCPVQNFAGCLGSGCLRALNTPHGFAPPTSGALILLTAPSPLLEHGSHTLPPLHLVLLTNIPRSSLMVDPLSGVHFRLFLAPSPFWVQLIYLLLKAFRTSCLYCYPLHLILTSCFLFSPFRVSSQAQCLYFIYICFVIANK